MNDRNRREFIEFLHHCTDAQVVGVYRKEWEARRCDYMQLVELEAARRGIEL